MVWPATLTIKVLNTCNPCFSAQNNLLAKALYEGGDIFDSIKPSLLYSRTQDTNPKYRESRLQVAEYENHISGMFDYSRAIVFQSPPRLIFEGPAEKLYYYNSLNNGLIETLEGRFSDMQLFGYGILTASYPTNPLPSAANNLYQQLQPGGPLDAKICYLNPETIQDWKSDDLGNLLWLKVHTAEDFRSVDYGAIDGKLHTWTFITSDSKCVYQKLQEKEREFKDADTAVKISETPIRFGLPVSEASLVDRNCVMERIKRAAVGLFNAESNWKFAVASQCFAQAWYAGTKEPNEFSSKLGENIVLFLGQGGQFGYAVPNNVAFDAVKNVVETETKNLQALINAEFKELGNKDQHAASGAAKHEDKEPAAVIAQSYAKKLRNALCYIVDYIIKTRRDEEIINYHLEGMDDFSPMALSDKIAALAAYKLIPGAAPTALKVAQRNLDHAMTPGATPEESASIDQENKEMEVPDPSALSSSATASSQSGAATSSGRANSQAEPTPASSASTAKSSTTGILPGTEEKPGDLRVYTKLKKISPKDLISQHGVDVQFKQELVSSMKDTGFDPAHPILVADTGLGYIILDGHHRGNAAAKAELKTIPANVISHDDYIGLLHSKFGGVRPNSLSALDPYIYVNGKPYIKIRDANEHDNKSKKIIAEKLTVTSSAVSSAKSVVV